MVLYINPIFLDYRIPFYKELDENIKGGLKVLYSPRRYYGRYETMLQRIQCELKDIAIPFLEWNGCFI